MIGTLLKALAYTKAPRTTFAVRHPVRTVQVAKVPFDLKTAYAPRLTALATALLLVPLAYRLGKRAGERTLWTPRRGGGIPAPPVVKFPTEL